MRFRGKDYEYLEDLIGDAERFNPLFFWVMMAGGVLASIMGLIGYLLIPVQ